VEGRAEFVSVSDTILNDSSLIVGYVRNVDWKDGYPNDFQKYEIWVEGTNISSITDSLGFYSIKTKPGTYSIKCQSRSNTWEQLIEELRDIELTKNTKMQIDFYIGYTIE